MNILPYSWWQSPKSKRTFVIIAKWYKPGIDFELDSIDILEAGKKIALTMQPECFMELVKKKELVELIAPE